MRIDSENIDDEDQVSINKQVPQFPEKKAPTYFKQEMLIIDLINQHKKASGHQKKEYECQLLRRFRNPKSHDCYMVEGQWAIRYTNYLYENSNTLPGILDNKPLDSLKKPVLNYDYYLVNEQTWKFLQDEYKGGPERILNFQIESACSSISESMNRTRSADISMISNVTDFTDRNPEVRLCGLKNELYFCYMHSALQGMFCITEFNDYFINSLRRIKSMIPKSLYDQMRMCRYYQELLEQINSSQNDYIKINSLRNYCIRRFSPKLQHDSEEFLLYLLSSIDDEINNLNKELQVIKIQRQINIVQNLFKGVIENKIICRNCNNTSINNEEFLTLSLALSKSLNLIQCLEDFLKEEKIFDYHCDKCNKKRQAFKRTKIINLPTYLLLHLKRFKFFPKQNKINSTISFPDPLIIQNNQYKITSIVVHQGSLESGHYYSFGKRKHKWYMFNDQSVKLVHKKDVLQQSAYILTYQKQNQQQLLP
ncbi:hypothetical protein pb186bvf_000156 [Paramecium bursaria]